MYMDTICRQVSRRALIRAHAYCCKTDDHALSIHEHWYSSTFVFTMLIHFVTERPETWKKIFS